MKNLYKIEDELYIISSSEKIKENNQSFKQGLNGDWFYNTIYNFITKTGDITPYDFKIILTTNKLLIKDSVQAIDDEFLEWFVKNPSCEEVYVEEEDYSQKCRECGETVKRGYNCKKGCFMKSGNFILTDKNIKYKIIIPKEEPLIEFTLIEKELIEEAKKLWQESHPNPIEMALFGAKWQQERMYSEEEVLELLRKAHFVEQNIEEWFKQFKKENTMTILELQNRVEVTTPKGKGFIWLVTEYGTETSKLFTVIQDTGEIWEWQPKDIKVLENLSFNRKL